MIFDIISSGIVKVEGSSLYLVLLRYISYLDSKVFGYQN